MSEERDYVLGTHDAELSRLGLQHAVWRRHALDGWLHAGFAAGQTILDVGCGPGYATLDLAEIAGTNGRVIAIDRSARFLRNIADKNLRNVETFEADLDRDDLPDVAADAAWARWVFAFTTRPRAVVEKVRARLKTGGVFVIHEYIDYASWRIAPRSEAFERFVQTVMASWRDNGGEPDVGLALPEWLASSGFTIQRLRPIVEILTPRDFAWQWPATFIEVGIERLLELERMTPAEADAVRDDVRSREKTAGVLMLTPAVVEIVAVAA